MSKEFIKLSELDYSQEYIIESEGARTKVYQTPSYNLRGAKDLFLYRRVVSNQTLRKNIELLGLGIKIKLLPSKNNYNGFDITNLIVVKIPKQYKQQELF